MKTKISQHREDEKILTLEGGANEVWVPHCDGVELYEGDEHGEDE
ncbi:hypothetical protein AVEN_8723-1, partial [Araneus ventricosus]